MKARIRSIVVLMILATIGIVIFQVSWLKTSYGVSRDKMLLEATRILDESILKHKDMVADTVRDLLKKTIRPQDIVTAVHYKMPDSQNVILGFRTKLFPKETWTSFKVNRKALFALQKDPYPFLLEKIEASNLDGLNGIYSTFVGIVDYEVGSEEEQLQDHLMRCFYLHEDVKGLNEIVQQRFDQLGKHMPVKILHFKGIDSVFKIKAKVSNQPIAGDETVIEVPIRDRNRATLTTRMDSLKLYINQLNERGEEIYVAKPILDDINTILRNEVSVIIMKIHVPFSYLLWQMSYSIMGSLLSLVLVGFCLTYMLYLILKQKKLAEIKDDFISNVSHELKTPVATTLAAIQGMQYFDVLGNKQKTDQYLNTAAVEMKRLSVMIDTILNSAIYERTSFELSLVKFNLKEMLVEMIDVQQAHAKKEVNIFLTYNAEEEVFADAIHLYQIVLNLIDNAIKYSLASAEISISVVTTPEGLSIQISDNGIGIPKNYHSQIFDQFFRVPSPNDHRVKGHGLGLHYVKNIIEKHNGKIKLVRSDETGSTFEITIPQ